MFKLRRCRHTRAKVGVIATCRSRAELELVPSPGQKRTQAIAIATERAGAGRTLEGQPSISESLMEQQYSLVGIDFPALPLPETES